MFIEGHVPAHQVSVCLPDSTSLKDAVQEFYDHHPGGTIHQINGREVIGICGTCKTPVFPEDPYSTKLVWRERPRYFHSTCEVR